MKHLFLVFSFFMTQNTWAQNDVQRQIEEIMKAREEMFRMLLNDHSFDDFDKRFEQIMKNFNQHGGFGLHNFDDPIVGEYDWVKTATHKILKIKVKQIKDKPLDIKIEKGMISLKGDVESVQGEGANAVRRRVSFQRAFSLPDDVDQNNPEFENKDGNLLIKFKLKNTIDKRKSTQSITEPERIPVQPDEKVDI